MGLFRKIKLSAIFAKGLYLVSMTMTLAASILALCEPLAVPVCILLKILSLPVVLYLFVSLSKGQNIYFYINLGISRIEYYAIPVTVEFVLFVICMVVFSSIGYAIG